MQTFAEVSCLNVLQTKRPHGASEDISLITRTRAVRLIDFLFGFRFWLAAIVKTIIVPHCFPFHYSGAFSTLHKVPNLASKPVKSCNKTSVKRRVRELGLGTRIQTDLCGLVVRLDSYILDCTEYRQIHVTYNMKVRNTHTHPQI